MHLSRVVFGAVVAASLVSACAPAQPPRVAIAEERIVMAPDANAAPLPEIDPAKPLAHDVHMTGIGMYTRILPR